MKKYILSLLIITLFFIGSSSSIAQKIRTCVAHEASNNLIQRDTNYAKNIINNEHIIAKPSTTERLKTTTYTIPVVVHVVYNNVEQYISNAQIQSQIDILNQDYSLTNANFATNTPAAFKALAGNAQLQFALAKRDPNGKPTNGITRTATLTTSFTLDDKVKSSTTGGADSWDSKRYLNIWVCHLGSALGYAYFPGGAANLDGVVIAYDSFGTIGTAVAPYNLGRTATHEIGHYFNLLHIWGDKSNCIGDDKISDTPQHHDANYACQVYPYKVCSANTADGEMFMNYMDYSPDDCMTMFSQGQVNRMVSTLINLRSTLLSSNVLTPISTTTDAGIFNIVSPTATENICGSVTPKIELTNVGSDTLKSVEIKTIVNNSVIATYNWTGLLPPSISVNVLLSSFTLNSSNNTLAFCTNLPNGKADQDMSNDTIKMSKLNITAVTLPLLESFESSTFPPTNWIVSNPNNDLTWEQSKVAAYVGTKSLVFKNFNGNSNINGEHDEIISPKFKCLKSTLTFYYAYKEYSDTLTPFDTLTVSVSADCGKTKTPVFKKGGDELVTSLPYYTTLFYVPANKLEWKKVSIPLSQYNNQFVTLYFDNQTNFENNLYIDSIYVSQDTILGLDDTDQSSQISIFPNPTENTLTINIAGGYENLIVQNLLGETVITKGKTENDTSIVNFIHLPNGIYLLNINKEGKSYWEKIVKN